MSNIEKPVKSPKTAAVARAPVAPDSFAARLRQTMDRLTMTDTQGADYLGVPVFTFRKWLAGERRPSAATVRLLDVLGIVETMAPTIHEFVKSSGSADAKKSA